MKIIVAFILFLIAMVIKSNNVLISNTIYIISYLIVGYEVLLKALKNIFKGDVFDENFLMSVATIGAFFVGEFPEAAMVMLLYQVGELFQDYAVDKSKKSIEELMNIRPDYANVVRNEVETKVHPSEVKIGEDILIKPGEKVPLDGIVLERRSFYRYLSINWGTNT